MKPETIKAIEAILKKGRCTEIRPTKTGFVVLETDRHKVYEEK